MNGPKPFNDIAYFGRITRKSKQAYSYGRAYYEKLPTRKCPDPQSRYHHAHWISSNGSLSECMVLSALDRWSAIHGYPVTCYSSCPMWDILGKQVGFRRGADLTEGVTAVRAARMWNCGAGHILQRLQVLSGLPIGKALLGMLPHYTGTQPGLVLMHLGAQRWGHCCQLKIQLRTIQVFLKFLRYAKDFKFIQVGSNPVPHLGTHVNCDMANLLEIASRCEYYIGIPSGVMHLMTALNKRCIVIISRINACDVALPVKKNIWLESPIWLYPQNIHLHEFGDGPQAKYISVDTLRQAINGELHPSLPCTWR